MSADLHPCPGGCGERLHPSAADCPKCGYRSRTASVEDILGSLGTLASILTGFGLSALVQVASVDLEKVGHWTLYVSIGCWSFASLLLLGVLVGAELLRRRERENRLSPARAEEERLWDSAQWLLAAFAFSLLPVAVGVVFLGFFFNLTLGFVGIVAVGIAAFVFLRALRPIT